MIYLRVASSIHVASSARSLLWRLPLLQFSLMKLLMSSLHRFCVPVLTPLCLECLDHCWVQVCCWFRPLHVVVRHYVYCLSPLLFSLDHDPGLHSVPSHALIHVLCTSFHVLYPVFFFQIIFVVVSHTKFFCGSWIAGNVLVFCFATVLFILAMVCWLLRLSLPLHALLALLFRISFCFP